VHDTDVAKVDLNVTYVAIDIHVCCKYLFRMFHLLQTYVASAFIWMLQWLYIYVASVYYKCFICFKRMLQKVVSCCKCFVSRCSRIYIEIVHACSNPIVLLIILIDVTNLGDLTA
jgi:hypothetical protein